ncbi:substrate-binding periplasmic protein [Dongshaea marina]|uniref:substrate-binding periplasmic protein n=1 Tax=Dongshaea marina TaxID=2047966 RepID=UPI000D3E6357|nr:transporter substrate-binding domain-containing protein [Dongshaea marina]
MFGAIVDEAFATQDVKPSYMFTSWSRAYRLSEEGVVTGTVPWGASVERALKHIYSDPIMEYRMVWFYLKGQNFDWQDYSDLKGKKVAAIRGYTYDDAFYQAAREGIIEVIFVNRLKQCFDLLLSGRVDLTIESFDVGYYTLNRHYQNAELLFTNHPKPVVLSHHYLLLSKKSSQAQKLINDFNQGLEALKKSGRVDELRLLYRKGGMSTP